MKKLCHLVALILSLTAFSAYPQGVSSESTAPRISDPHLDSFDDLFNDASIVIEGRYGAILARSVDYGPFTKEEMMRRTGLSEQEVVKSFGAPMAHYEILVDRILKGEELVGDGVVLRVNESPDEPEVFPWIREAKEGGHLFFFLLKDGAIQRAAPDLRVEEGKYFYYEGRERVQVLPEETPETIRQRAVELVAIDAEQAAIDARDTALRQALRESTIVFSNGLVKSSDFSSEGRRQVQIVLAVLIANGLNIEEGARFLVLEEPDLNRVIFQRHGPGGLMNDEVTVLADKESNRQIVGVLGWYLGPLPTHRNP